MYDINIGLILSEGEDQGPVKLGLRIKIRQNYHMARVLWFIWIEEFGGDILFQKFHLRKCKRQFKFGHIRSNQHIRNFLTKSVDLFQFTLSIP